MKKLLLACLLALLASVAPAQAQEPGRMLLEAGIVGGNSIACPGHYVGLEGLLGLPGICVRHGRELPLHRGPRDVQPSRPVADARTRRVIGTPRAALRAGVQRRRRRLLYSRRQPDVRPAVRSPVHRRPLDHTQRRGRRAAADRCLLHPLRSTLVIPPRPGTPAPRRAAVASSKTRARLIFLLKAKSKESQREKTAIIAC